MYIDKVKIFDFFKDLTFQESDHKYFVNGDPISVSVSGLLYNFTVPVDFTEISKAVANKEGTTPEKVRERWDYKKRKACKIGSETHLFGELYAFNRNIEPKNGLEEAVVRFWNDLPNFIVPVIMELQMYHKKYKFAGTSDILLFDIRNNTFIIADYKTNEDLFKNFKGKKLKAPFNHLLDNNFNKYQLQLSFYQILFEQLGLEVSMRKLIWLRPSGTYTMYDTKDYTKELLDYLENNPISCN